MKREWGCVGSAHTLSTEQLLIGNSLSVLLRAGIFMQYISLIPPQGNHWFLPWQAQILGRLPLEHHFLLYPIKIYST